MNQEHLQLCSSTEWAEHIERDLIPWALEDVELGEHLIEVGPGPGAATQVLRHRVNRLTAVESDSTLATQLAERLAGTNVEVVHADATELPFVSQTFSAAASFIMLHHVPSAELQDKLLAELARVLRSGGVLFGVDSLDSPEFREFHQGDVCVPINPLSLGDRLRSAGFTQVDITVWQFGTRFRAATAAI